ncbi:hypothetical protein B0H12DRAFT_108000 [Mycena haematopus]|nr:hypothetical protein B0H12DRAFT_108000 [Mycena haematopus]
MFATSSLAVLLSAAAAVTANTHQARSHNAIAKRVESGSFTLDKRAQYTNKEFTWYPTDTGPDACTGKNHQDSDFYVAMGFNQFGDGSACCGKQMSITVNGKTATATCVDECATCPDVGQLDFTKGLFEYFSGGDLDVGVLYGSWSYTDGSGGGNGGGGNDDPTTTTKKQTQTTTKHTTTATPTTTHHTTTSTTHAAPPAVTTHTSAKPSSSSKKASSSSAKPSSSSIKHSSSVKASSSTHAKSSTSALPLPTPAQGVANAGSSGGEPVADSDGDNTGISGAIGTGSGTSGASALSFNKLFATVAVVALVAAQAL